MMIKLYQRGALLIAAIVLVVIIAALVTAMSFLTVSNIGASGSHLGSAQALFIAQSGLQRAIYQYKSGTACTSLTNTNLVVGAGNFSTSGVNLYPTGATNATLNGALTASATIIPVTIGGGGAFANFAPHGRIGIDNEDINYSGTSTSNAVCGTQPCFTGATRGVRPTTSAAHSSGAAVSQPSQCLIRSTGVVGAASRILESAVLAKLAWLYYLDWNPVLVSSAAGGNNIGSTSTISGYNPPAGDNLIIASVSFRNTTAVASPIQNIAAGNLQLRKGATVLASNQFIIRVAGNPPTGTAFPQTHEVLLYRDAGAAANAQYDVFAQASVNNQISAEVKMLVINGVPPNSSFQDGASTALGLNIFAAIFTHNSNVPAGDNVVLAAIQVDNPNSTQTRTIDSFGDLNLARTGGPTLETNRFQMGFTRSTRVRRSMGFLFVARDPGAPANPQYTVNGKDNNATGPTLNGEVKMLVLNGVPSTGTSAPAGVGVGTGATSVTGGALATAFAEGQNAVFGSIQHRNNTTPGQGNILAGNESIVFGGSSVSSTPYDLNLGTAGVSNDYIQTLLWGQTTARPNPTYDLQAQASNSGVCITSYICADGSLVALNLPSPVIDWQESF